MVWTLSSCLLAKSGYPLLVTTGESDQTGSFSYVLQKLFHLQILHVNKRYFPSKGFEKNKKERKCFGSNLWKILNYFYFHRSIQIFETFFFFTAIESSVRKKNASKTEMNF